MICYFVYDADKLSLYNTFSALFVFKDFPKISWLYSLQREINPIYSRIYLLYFFYIYIHLIQTLSPSLSSLPSHTCSLHNPNSLYYFMLIFTTSSSYSFSCQVFICYFIFSTYRSKVISKNCSLLLMLFCCCCSFYSRCLLLFLLLLFLLLLLLLLFLLPLCSSFCCCFFCSFVYIVIIVFSSFLG